jgi:hypothetical protein
MRGLTSHLVSRGMLRRFLGKRLSALFATSGKRNVADIVTEE